MAKRKNNITNRLAAISNAAPKAVDPTGMLGRKRMMRASRETVFRSGKIYTRKDDFYRCMIINQSSTGVLARMEGEYALPNIVIFRFIQTGVTKKARIVWQDEGDVGLAFLEDIIVKRKQRPSIVRSELQSKTL